MQSDQQLGMLRSKTFDSLIFNFEIHFLVFAPCFKVYLFTPHLFLCQSLLCNSLPHKTQQCAQHWEVVSFETWDERRPQFGLYYHVKIQRLSGFLEAELVGKQGLTGWWPSLAGMYVCIGLSLIKPNMSNILQFRILRSSDLEIIELRPSKN